MKLESGPHHYSLSLYSLRSCSIATAALIDSGAGGVRRRKARKSATGIHTKRPLASQRKPRTASPPPPASLGEEEDDGEERRVYNLRRSTTSSSSRVEAVDRTPNLVDLESFGSITPYLGDVVKRPRDYG